MFDDFVLNNYPNNDLFEELKRGDNRYLFLDGIVQEWSKDKTPSTVKSYFGFVRDWLKVNGIKTTYEDIKDFVKFHKPLKERRVAITESEIKSLLKYSNQKSKSLILFLVSSGARIDCEVLRLQVRHIQKINGMYMLNIPAVIAKSREERITFITKQCYDLMDLGSRNPDEYIFDFTYQNANKYLKSMRQKAELESRYQTNVHHITLHTFRSFFITKANKVEDGFGHALAGHGKYMKSYERWSDEEMADLYRQLEPQLTF